MDETEFKAMRKLHFSPSQFQQLFIFLWVNLSKFSALKLNTGKKKFFQISSKKEKSQIHIQKKVQIGEWKVEWKKNSFQTAKTFHHRIKTIFTFDMMKNEFYFFYVSFRRRKIEIQYRQLLNTCKIQKKNIQLLPGSTHWAQLVSINFFFHQLLYVFFCEWNRKEAKKGLQLPEIRIWMWNFSIMNTRFDFLSINILFTWWKKKIKLLFITLLSFVDAEKLWKIAKNQIFHFYESWLRLLYVQYESIEMSDWNLHWITTQ